MNNIGTRLLLIMPPQSGLLNGFAAGLISLANFVRAKMPDVTTEILDLSTDSFYEAERHLRCSLDRGDLRLFVGITTTTAGYQAALQVANIVRDASPRAIVVLGGHHASADSEFILRRHSDVVDLIIIGEGERSLCDLIRLYPSIEEVGSLAFLDPNNCLVRTKSGAPLTQAELDSIPISYGDNGLIGTPGKFDHVTYVSARGCPLRCAFCAVANERIRAKSVPVVIQDIEDLLDMGFTRIAIEDNFFAHSAARTRDLCKALAELKRKRDFAWDCQTRVESLARKGTITQMAEAGCEAVYIGVESIHPDQLLYLNKTNNPSKYLHDLVDVVVPALLETTVDCYLNLQFGVPGETIKHERMTFEVLSHLGNLATSHGKCITVFPQLHVVYPGTAHFQEGIAQGRFPSDVFESFTEWEFRQAPVLFWLGEHFAHGTGGIPEGILNHRLLRKGLYEVDTSAVFRISAALRSIDRIPGMKTFNYGDYLVADAGFQRREDHFPNRSRNGVL